MHIPDESKLEPHLDGNESGNHSGKHVDSIANRFGGAFCFTECSSNKSADLFRFDNQLCISALDADYSTRSNRHVDEQRANCTHRHV